MWKSYIFTSLALVTLLVACGIGSDGQTNLRPAPPASNSEVQEPQASELADSKSDGNPEPWYERYDLSKVVVKIEPGALSQSTESKFSAGTSRFVSRPTRGAYTTRLQVLQQARESLLRENAALAARLELQTRQPNREQLRVFREQFGNLRNKQRLVMTRTQAVEVEHQKLLSMLTQTVATVDLRTNNW